MEGLGNCFQQSWKYSVDLKGKKIEKSGTNFLHDGNLVTTHWKDRHDVSVITTIYGNGIEIIQKPDEEPLTKPTTICEYTKFMGGVIFDQYLNYYPIWCKVTRNLEKHLFPKWFYPIYLDSSADPNTNNSIQANYGNSSWILWS